MSKLRLRGQLGVIPKCSLGTDLMICDSYCTVQLFRWLTEFQVAGGLPAGDKGVDYQQVKDINPED